MNRRDFFKFLPLAAAVGAVVKAMQPKRVQLLNPQYRSIRGVAISKWYAFDMNGEPFARCDFPWSQYQGRWQFLSGDQSPDIPS